jgi:hypothetical protein
MASSVLRTSSISRPGLSNAASRQSASLVRFLTWRSRPAMPGRSVRVENKETPCRPDWLLVDLNRTQRVSGQILTAGDENSPVVQ